MMGEALVGNYLTELGGLIGTVGVHGPGGRACDGSGRLPYVPVIADNQMISDGVAARANGEVVLVLGPPRQRPRAYPGPDVEVPTFSPI